MRINALVKALPGYLALGLWTVAAGWGCGTGGDTDQLSQVEIGSTAHSGSGTGEGTPVSAKAGVDETIPDDPIDESPDDPIDESPDDPIDESPDDPIDESLLAVDYVFEFTEEQPWLDLPTGTTETEALYVSGWLYVPGSHTLTSISVPVYVTTYTSGANSLGDLVGSVYNIYGADYAFADPYDAPIRYLYYPDLQVIGTSLVRVNDDRLAIGSYTKLGGYQYAFIYDLVTDAYTPFVAPDTEWTVINDLNNSGRLVGVSINDDGASRTGFVYDCENGFHFIHVPGSTWTVPLRIDEEGAVYGYFSGLADVGPYFVARPTAEVPTPTCVLTDLPSTD